MSNELGDKNWASQFKNQNIPKDVNRKQDTGKERAISYERFTRMQQYNAEQQQKDGRKLPSRRELADSMLRQVNVYENSFEGWKQFMKDMREAQAMKQHGPGPIRPGEIRQGDERYRPY